MEFSTLQLIYSESYTHHENFKSLYYGLMLVYFIVHTYGVQEFASFGLQTQTPWFSSTHKHTYTYTHTHTQNITLVLSLETHKPSA